MRIAFSGTHRTGKSTLAKILAEKLNLPFVPMEVAKMPVWENSGISPADAKNITFAERVAIQYQILDYMENNLKGMGESNPEGFVTDRSPVDVFAYMIAGIDNTCSRLYDEDIQLMEMWCQEWFRRYIDFVYIVPMFPKNTKKVVEYGKSGKVYDSYSYQRLIDLVIRSVSYGVHGVRYIPEVLSQTSLRANWVYNHIKSEKHNQFEEWIF